MRQCQGLEIPVVDTIEAAGGLSIFDCAVDAIFGFSFHGAPRPPFDDILAQLTNGPLPVLSVDVPSGWDVARRPLQGGSGQRSEPAARGAGQPHSPQIVRAVLHGAALLGGAVRAPVRCSKVQLEAAHVPRGGSSYGTPKLGPKRGCQGC